MRKIRLLPLLAALLLALSACFAAPSQSEPLDNPGGSEAPPDETPPGGSTSSEPAPPSESEPPEPEAPPPMPTLTADYAAADGLDTAPVPWGPGVRRNAANRSEACDLLQAQYGAYGARFIEPDEKSIYLTFDLGYENGHTAAVLDTLKDKGVPAVFFVTGHYVTSQPDLVQRVLDEGHVLGSHSYGHISYADAAPEDAFADMNRLHEAVYERFGVTLRLFRFPEGVFSARALRLVQSVGYDAVFWSFAYRDWDPANQMPPEEALSRALEGAHNGCIYLLHTVGETNALILPDLIDALRAEGYSLEQLRPSAEAAISPSSAPSSSAPSSSAPSSSAPSSSAPSSSAPSSSAPSSSAPSSSAPPSSSNIFLRPR